MDSIPGAPSVDRWQTKFARFVRWYGVARLARELEIDPSALYQWIRGATAPRHLHTRKIVDLAREHRKGLTFEDVYRQRERLAPEQKPC